MAGHLELRDRAGARIHLGARAQADYDFSPLRDGDVLEFGQVRLRVLETPGHTPEAISLLLYDLAVSDRAPQAVLTGDTLFIGDVGRPDLMASVGSQRERAGGHALRLDPPEALAAPRRDAGLPGPRRGIRVREAPQPGARVHHRRAAAVQLRAPADVEGAVRPGDHRRPAGGPAVLRLRRRAEPARARHAGRPSWPASYERLSLDEVLAAQRDGAQLLDVRDPADFAAGHLAGSLNISLGGPVRRVGRNPARADAPDRPGHDARPRARGGHPARTRRIRHGGGLSGRRGRGGPEPARPRAARGARDGRGPPGCACTPSVSRSSTSAPRRSTGASRSPGASTSRCTSSARGSPTCRPAPGSSSTARAGSGRPPR